MKLVMRKLKYNDIQTINKWNIEKFQIEIKRKNNRLMGADDSFPYVALLGESIFGYSEFFYDKEGYITISIAINPKYQNKKMGKFFLENIISYIIENNLSNKDRINIWVEANNKRAIALYKNFGFIPIDNFINSLGIIPMYYKIRRKNELS